MNRNFFFFTILFMVNFIGVSQVKVPETYFSTKVMNMNISRGFPSTAKYDTTHLNEINLHLILSLASNSLDTSGQFDVSDTLNHYINKAFDFEIEEQFYRDNFVTILLPPGRYKIEKPILMKSNVVIKGTGIEETHFICNVGEGKHCFVFSPSNMGRSTLPFDTLNLARDVMKGESYVQVPLDDFRPYEMMDDTSFLAGLLNQKDSGLITSSWAMGTVKELFMLSNESNVKNDSSFLISNRPVYHALDWRRKTSKPFVLNYSKNQSKVLLYHSIENSGLQCLSIIRADTTSSQTSNIIFNNAHNCHLVALKSTQCNFGHVTLNNSNYNLVKRCVISDGNNYGGGGKAYGIVLQQASSNNTLTDNVLKHLRHSILLQSGANNNIILANYSYDPYWEQLGLPSDAAGDMVLHGNYPFGNLIESNVAQQLVLDNSHGKNGPFNVFHRNWFQNYGIFMSETNGSDSQVFTGNEITNRSFLKGLYTLRDRGHFQYGNKQGDLIIPTNTSAPLVKYLHSGYYHYVPRRTILPMPSSFLHLDSVPYGEPYDQINKSIPALERQMQIPNCLEWDDYYNYANVNQVNNKTNFIYPNPSEGWIKTKQEGSLIIFDLQGRKVFEKEVRADHEIKVHLKGLFIAHLQTEKGVFTQKLRIVY